VHTKIGDSVDALARRVEYHGDRLDGRIDPMSGRIDELSLPPSYCCL
jgi:hypothetical protein